MASHGCAEKCDACDDSGLRDGRRQRVEAVHWAAPNVDAAYQEEVCSGPSWRGCEEDDVVQEACWASEGALFRDQIEYPSDLSPRGFSPDQVSMIGQPCAPFFDVELQRTGRSWCDLGVKVALVGGSEVRVTDVHKRGLIPDWNACHSPSLQILPGDRIIQVNGDISNAKDLYDGMQEAVMGSALRLRVAPPARRVDAHSSSMCQSPSGSTVSGNSLSSRSSFGF